MSSFRSSANLSIALLATACTLLSTHAYATDVEIKMLTKGRNGTSMVFEPALVHIAQGDSVHFVAVDKTHNVESIPNMIPDGTAPFAGKLNEDLTLKLSTPGVYGYECKPHYGMGMVGLIIVGKPVNEDAAKAAMDKDMPSIARKKFATLFKQFDAKSVGN